jgi:hypothetical protein
MTFVAALGTPPSSIHSACLFEPFDDRFHSRYRFQVAAEGLHFRGILWGTLLNRHYTLPKADDISIRACPACRAACRAASQRSQAYAQPSPVLPLNRAI